MSNAKLIPSKQILKIPNISLLFRGFINDVK